MMKSTVLIPVKSLELAKSRLASTLNSEQRQTLVLLMLQHVLETIKSTSKDFEIFVVSADTKILALAKAFGVGYLSEEKSGHNRALTDAAKQVNQELPLLAISADLPLLTRNNLRQMFSLIRNNDAVLAQSKEKTGTNAILTKNPMLIPFQFGNNSFAKFKKVLEKKHLTYKSYFHETVAFDIDTKTDFEKFKTTLHHKQNILHKFYNKVLR